MTTQIQFKKKKHGSETHSLVKLTLETMADVSAFFDQAPSTSTVSTSTHNVFLDIKVIVTMGLQLDIRTWVFPSENSELKK